MNQNSETIWTWCPKCTVRTDHTRVKGVLRCQVCGCLHMGEKCFKLDVKIKH